MAKIARSLPKQKVTPAQRRSQLINRQRPFDVPKTLQQKVAAPGPRPTPSAIAAPRKAPAQGVSAPSAGRGSPSYSGGGSFGGGAAGGALGGMTVTSAAAPMSVPEPPKPRTWEELSEAERTDYLKGDATYTAQQSALEQELQNLIAELGLQRTNYQTDYTSALSNMGWNQDQNSFDPKNLLGAYGASYANQENDFANRGMLDSSGYANALTNLNTSFDKQKGDLDNSRSNFLRELQTRETGARNTNTQDIQRARADAIARRAAREGLV